MQIAENFSYTNEIINGQSDFYGSTPRPNVSAPLWPIRGTGWNDVIHGTNENNKIHGLGGVDVIYGNGGNDTIYTGGAVFTSDDWRVIIDEYAYGGAGHDTLHGSAVRDYQSGGTENDTLFGYAGDDWLNGGLGSDTMKGGRGKDIFVFHDILEMQNDTIIDFNLSEGDILGFGTPLDQANGGVFFSETTQDGAKGVKMTFNKIPTADNPGEYSGSLFVQGMTFEEAWDIIMV